MEISICVKAKINLVFEILLYLRYSYEYGPYGTQGEYIGNQSTSYLRCLALYCSVK